MPGGIRDTHEHTRPARAHAALGDLEAARGSWEGGSHWRQSFETPSPPLGGGPHDTGQERTAVGRQRDPPPLSSWSTGQGQAHVPCGAHGGAAQPCGYKMLITVTFTEALA